MLNYLITSKLRRKLLSVFFTNPHGSFYARSLARALSAQTNEVWAELKNLQEGGFLVTRREGNLIYYSANRQNPLYEELRRIILKTEGLGSQLVDEFAKIGGAHFAFIYGSAARGDEGAKSDIDLMIIGDAKMDEISRLVQKIERKTAREINYSIYPSAEFLRRKKEGFLRRVLADKKIMLIGDEDEFKRFAS
ncbi:hypothetical protein AUJ17_05525 [Candidatus Micrarchaeota archaeon CG1_02_47_40]|nr:MAG: hypothetical protein AUJ17_05525 [Candidatus Micrarchaeota archaeon CG1_02_47_40]